MLEREAIRRLFAVLKYGRAENCLREYKKILDRQK